VARALRQAVGVNVIVQIAARDFALAVGHVQAHGEAFVVLLVDALEAVEVRAELIIVIRSCRHIA